jgi:hypothetical protein
VTTAAALIIGDELLSGKVRDTNGPLLIDLLRGLGVRLQRLVYLGDTVAEIAANSQPSGCRCGCAPVVSARPTTTGSPRPRRLP